MGVVKDLIIEKKLDVKVICLVDNTCLPIQVFQTNEGDIFQDD